METKYARRASRMALLAGVLALGACTVPPLDQMAKGCDSDHPCADGWVCSPVDSKCYESGKEPPTPECEANETRPCAQTYSEVGECKLGTQTCGADRRWAACVGAVGPTSEVCDLKDNDCDDKTDGADDSLVTVACPKQSGVCAGSQKACVEGVMQDCTDANYGTDYMADESLCKGEVSDPASCNGRLGCDGKDNDCDGVVDNSFEDGDYDRDLFGAQGTKCIKNPSGAPYDCNDADPAVFPGAPEVCDGRDNDCSDAPDDGSAPVQMQCVFGSFALNCPLPSGSALGNCSADCADACSTPIDICNGEDDDGDGVTDKDDEYVSGPWGLGGNNTMAATLTALPEGGYLAAFIRQVSTRTFVGMQRLTGKASNGKPEAGQVIEVATLAGSARKVAITPYHAVWLDTVRGRMGIRAAGISKGLAVGAPFDVFWGDDSNNIEVESLTATPLGEGTTLVAAGVQGGTFLFVRVLTGKRAIIPTTAQVAGATNPSFGSLPSGPVLFFEKAGNIGWREVSTQGDVGATEYAVSPAPAASSTYNLPSGAQSAVAYEKRIGTNTQVEVVRIGSAGQVGTPLVVSGTWGGWLPALASFKSGTDYIYSLGHVAAGNPGSTPPAPPTARFLNLTWNGSLWQKSQYEVGYTMTNLQRVITAGDGTWFVTAYQGQPTTTYDTQLRFNCFFHYE